MYNLSVICPDPTKGLVTLHSIANHSSSSTQDSGLSTMMVELTGPSPVTFSWLAYTPDPPVSALSGSLSAAVAASSACEHRCPGLGCVSAALWCDGHEDCPGTAAAAGWDEKNPACAALAPVKLMLGLAVAGVVFFAVTAVVLVSKLRACSKNHQPAAAAPSPQRRPSKRASNGTVETMLNHKENCSLLDIKNIRLLFEE